MEGAIYAALDLGSNNCRLLVARRRGQGFEVVDAFSRIVRLGEGLCQTGRLSDAAISRTLDALRICARKLRRWPLTKTRYVATDACRRASNCQAFLTRVRKETGLEFEIISNSEEARLAYTGCAPLLDPNLSQALIFDIGGGSTEISWLEWDAGRLQRRDWCSLPLGVITLAERFGGRSNDLRTYAAMRDTALTALQPFERRHRLAEKVHSGELQMIGTSGTVTTLAGVHQDLPRYDRRRVDGCYLRAETIVRLSQRIAAMSYEERVAHGCIGPQRADLVVAGCAILHALCHTWPVDRLRVADRGLREGILLMLMQSGTCAPCRPGMGFG